MSVSNGSALNKLISSDSLDQLKINDVAKRADIAPNDVDVQFFKYQVDSVEQTQGVSASDTFKNLLNQLKSASFEQKELLEKVEKADNHMELAKAKLAFDEQATRSLIFAKIAQSGAQAINKITSTN
ncbi:hypothetical protein CS022_17150 [Veronia nyctiphanis]|uniref:Uncharacterized protein n=1 Tax=Veronia nyctiphanis TaxID=1278244 RepID=A0A4Q0YMY5_9GAMM|nr:hypothetical protein [Veronia nyctiphanis]RXJ72272.1 hypothetical protein CS022_17150 [Veronia nyctiphanis]